MTMFETDDFRQMGVVARNEVRKFVSSRKFAVYVALVVISLALVTFLPYIVGDGLSGSAGGVFYLYVMFAAFMAVLATTLFASNTIVSEFEERTALILFTRPIRKSSIFMGKLLACLLMEAIVIVAYYAVGALVAFLVSGDFVSSFAPSLAMALAYMFACSGIGILISSFSKKAGTAAVITFITILLLISIVTTALDAAGIDTWFMLDTASNAILTTIPEYVDMSNAMFEQMGQEMGMDLSSYMVGAADTVRSGLVMLAWGVVSTLGAWLLFSKREF
ncbi:MAG: ABC transporter permease [Thermoplasmata archaeon]|nr:ABC transporter permease [Thermoplasmata archaeon]